MPNINETRQILEEAFITGWGVTTPIAYDNVIEDESIQEYVEMRYVPYDNTNASIGNTLTRLEGAMVIAIYTKYNTGSGRAWDLADQVNLIMSNKCHAQGLFTVASKPRRNGDEKEGWFSVLCSIPFTSDECII